MMKNNSLLLLAVVLLEIIVWGCGPKTVTTLVHQGSLIEVKLQHTIGKDQKPVDAGYQHPIALSPEEIEQLLKSIQIRYRADIFEKIFSGSRPETERVFSDEQVTQMSVGISKALAAATSADRINLWLKHPRGILTPAITTGVIYVKDNRLVIVLGNYQYIPPAGVDNLHDRLTDPLDVQGAQTVTMIPGPFQELLQTDRRSLKNRGLSVDYKGLLAFRPQQPLKTEESKTPPDLQEKLTTLKRLRDQGLITEEDYQEKKKELLKEF
jgi:hypothetical protein